MQQLANITVTPRPGHLFDSWEQARQWLTNMGISGFEIYPHGELNAKQIPSELVGGLHLKSFPILTPLLHNDSNRLLQIFGDWHTVEQFYGGTDASHIITTLVNQFNLAATLNAPYVVFHPMDCDMENLFTQDFPWTTEDTFNACAELLNQAIKQSQFNGWLLFENMWWKQSFRLDTREEYDNLRAKVNYSKCGICFDTGHMMSTNTSLTNESDAISFLMNRLHQLDLPQEIKTLHLNSNLSSNKHTSLKQTKQLFVKSEHVRSNRPEQAHYNSGKGFWEQFNIALQHITQLDPHQGFQNVVLSPLIEAIAPDYLVHEISQLTLSQWSRAISRQRACFAMHPSKSEPSTNQTCDNQG